MTSMSAEEYWRTRQNFEYYALVKRWLEELSASKSELSICDVGSYHTPVATWGTFARRYTVDIKHAWKLPGVTSFVADFRTWKPPHHMTAVTCLQVLEHLPDSVIRAFSLKLRLISDHTFVSVPFMWKRGQEPDHRQDPINLAKLSRWMGREPDEHHIVHDTKHDRLVARWNNTR